MPITSLLIRTKAERTAAIADEAALLQGVEIAEIRNDIIVAVTDTATRDEDKGLWDTLEQITGVLTVDAIYHNFEDVLDTEAPEMISQETEQ